MIFEAAKLDEVLAQDIASVFHFAEFKPDHAIERVVPTGQPFLIFELDGFARHTYDPSTLTPNATFECCWLAGVHRRHLSISAHQDSEMLVVQFQAVGARPFLHMELSEFADRVVDAKALLGDEVSALRQSMLEARSAGEKLSVMTNWLRDRRDPKLVAPEPLRNVLTRLTAAPTEDLESSTSDYPYTQKHLIDQFKRYVGIPPKVYQRILRFNEVLERIRRRQVGSWAELSALCGFADQSHFIKEFRYFSGFGPTEFIEREFPGEDANFFPLDREG